MVNSESYFLFSYTVENLLFKGLSVSSVSAFIGLCLGVSLFTFLYEAVKAFRHQLVTLLTNHKDDPYTSIAKGEVETSKIPPLSWFDSLPRKTVRRIKFHCLQTLLHMLQLTMGYFVMLIIMSWNAWLLITVIITNMLCFYFHDYVLFRKPIIVPVEVTSASL